MTPFVSCICPTFGRAPQHLHLLAECVESFLRQDYPPQLRELVILNDCSQQTLACDAPGVRCVNVRQRYATLGSKYNAAIAMARGEVLLSWEDDDISLPGRISQAVGRLFMTRWCDEWKDGQHKAWEEKRELAYFNPQRSWFLDQGGANPDGKGLHCQHTHGVCHNAGAFTRAAFTLVGGYPEVTSSQDAGMDQRLKALGRTAPRLSDNPAEWTFIYRWSMSDRHISGFKDPQQAYDSWNRRPWPIGKFKIDPRWQQDYVAMVQEALRHVQA